MSLVVRVLGSRPVATAGWSLTARRLRVLTYHRIPDPPQFARQLDCLADLGCRTVTGDQVHTWLGGADLGRRPVWITFDDGDPTVVSAGLAALAQRSMHATAFVCPGLVDTDRPHWWDLVERAANLLADVPSVGSLKQVDDQARRAVVDDLTGRLAANGADVTARQWTTADIHAWLAAGNEIGNHTWDHPCLDRCSVEARGVQVRAAHDRLVRLMGRAPTTFAWPNGNVAGGVQAQLGELGYRLVLRCDHRLTARTQRSEDLSRLKVDSDADLVRFRAILSGAHSGVFHLGAGLRARLQAVTRRPGLR
ncbi:MAG: polysaccharide deacetylase family protein [Ilumatobacteraceae bacterium]